MTVCIFAGPTIQHDDVSRLLDAEIYPPAAQGDVYAAACKMPVAIGIIDGYFHRVPSIWHKEILWALSKGIHVFGSASMGALRAAELHSFGMVGVGRIFEDYRDGRIWKDDEVAVIHGPPEIGYIALSEAMANIRATLAAALGDGIICDDTHGKLVNIAQSTFFPERSYDGLLKAAVEEKLPDAQISTLSGWLRTGKIDQKKIDAVSMLEEMARFVGSSPEPLRVNYQVENTQSFDDR